MLIHSLCLGRQKQSIDSSRATNEKSMGVRSSLALRQGEVMGGQAGSGGPWLGKALPGWACHWVLGWAGLRPIP